MPFTGGSTSSSSRLKQSISTPLMCSGLTRWRFIRYTIPDLPCDVYVFVVLPFLSIIIHWSVYSTHTRKLNGDASVWPPYSVVDTLLGC